MTELLGKNIVVFDTEIKKPIEECSRGWESHDEMGISVACAYDYLEGRFRVFMEDNILELVDRLNEPGTLIVAFNHVGFDNKLLRCAGPLLSDDYLNNFDMLLASREGAKADKYAKGFKLDDHLKALGLPMKTGAGANAPIWWKQGLVGKVVDYCAQDVYSEKALFEHIVKHQTLACAYQSIPYRVNVPIIIPGTELVVA